MTVIPIIKALSTKPYCIYIRKTNVQITLLINYKSLPFFSLFFPSSFPLSLSLLPLFFCSRTVLSKNEPFYCIIIYPLSGCPTVPKLNDGCKTFIRFFYESYFRGKKRMLVYTLRSTSATVQYSVYAQVP